MLQLNFNWSRKVVGVKIIKSNVLYPDICVADMFPSFKLDWIVRRLSTPEYAPWMCRLNWVQITFQIYHVNLIFMDPCIVDNSVEIPTRCSFLIEFIIPKFIEGSTCFERHTAHYQEL